MSPNKTENIGFLLLILGGRIAIHHFYFAQAIKSRVVAELVGHQTVSFVPDVDAVLMTIIIVGFAGRPSENVAMGNGVEPFFVTGKPPLSFGASVRKSDINLS